jgi:ubiquitin-conjugating enzyme E2 M
MSRLTRQVRSVASLRELRIQKDLTELESFIGVKVSFPQPDYLFRFRVEIKPADGMWKLGKFEFEFDLPPDWPIGPPRVKILTRTWHPNVTESGEVCLNLLKEDYTPVTTIDQLVAGLKFLFMEPCAVSPLNAKAAVMLQRDPKKFQETVDEYIKLYCPK